MPIDWLFFLRIADHFCFLFLFVIMFERIFFFILLCYTSLSPALRGACLLRTLCCTKYDDLKLPENKTKKNLTNSAQNGDSNELGYLASFLGPKKLSTLLNIRPGQACIPGLAIILGWSLSKRGSYMQLCGYNVGVVTKKDSVFFKGFSLNIGKQNYWLKKY